MSPSLISSPCLAVVTLALWLHGGHCEEGTVSAIYEGNATFHCDLERSDPPNVSWMDWVWTENRDPVKAWDSNSGKNPQHLNKDRFVVDPVTLDLIITGVSDDDVGTYFCRSVVNGKTLESSEKELIVATKPLCSGLTEVSEGGRLSLVCEAQFSGSIPDLDWYRDGVKVERNTETSLGETRNTFEEDITYDMDQNIFTCKMDFEGAKDECSRTLDVKYRVHDPIYEPMKDAYASGDVVRCSSMGNPAPAVELEVPEGTATEKGESWVSFIVLEAWEGHTITVNCTASNVFNTETEIRTKSLAFRVAAPEPEPTTPRSATPAPDIEINDKSTTKGASVDDKNDGVKSAGTNTVAIVAGIVIGVLVLVIVIVAIVCVHRRKGKKVPKGAKQVPTNDANADVGEKA